MMNAGTAIELEETRIDYETFRLNYSSTVYILLVFFVIIITMQFVGEAIHCEVISDESYPALNTYCWTHPTFVLPKAFFNKVAPELQRRMRTGIWQLLPKKQTEHSIRPVSFSLQSNSLRTLIWRAPGTRYHQENNIERHRYGGAGWLNWGGIILGSRTDLHVQNVTMTGHIYRDVILEQHVHLFRGAMGAEFLFMDDNARPHRANIVDECLQSEDMTRMDWLAYSPDLNPIEHVWDMLVRRIAARQPPPTCLPELRRALLDEWCNIPQDQIDNLILSIARRFKAFIASSGRRTPYLPSY
ncbi:transposable element Tc3 transposase [Trichonephila clavipes]|nr:transposable element Tc3 transposase [Trichonephila clavipes]